MEAIYRILTSSLYHGADGAQTYQLCGGHNFQFFRLSLWNKEEVIWLADSLLDVLTDGQTDSSPLTLSLLASVPGALMWSLLSCRVREQGRGPPCSLTFTLHLVILADALIQSDLH